MDIKDFDWVKENYSIDYYKGIVTINDLYIKYCDESEYYDFVDAMRNKFKVEKRKKKINKILSKW